MLTEAQLRLFNNRDHRVFDMIFKYYHWPIYLYACNKIKDETEAEDIIMNVFMDLYNSQEIFEKAENLNAYIYRLAINRCLNFIKYKNRQRANSKELTNQNNHDENNDVLIQDEMTVMNALIEIAEQLPGKYGKVARLILDQRTYQQIADELNISLDMVYKLRDYAIKKIQNRLKGI